MRGDDFLPQLRRALQSLGSAVHMLRDPGADANAAAFICAAAQKQLQELADALEPQSEKARRVLIVDADRAWVDVLAETLRLEGHAIEAATTSADLLATCSSFRPDVVIADLGLTGQTAARNLRSVRSEAALVALSGWTRESDARLAKELGWDHYLHKPLSPVQLARLVATLPPGNAGAAPVASPAAQIGEARRARGRQKPARARA